MAGYSYSLYVVHFPLMVLMVAVLFRAGVIGGRLAPGATAFSLLVTCLAIAYGAAWLFSLATERQTGNLRRLISGQLIRWEGIGAATEPDLNAGAAGDPGPHPPELERRSGREA